MRKKNSTTEFSSERSEFLIRSYRQSLAEQSVISIQRAFHDAKESPAPRFWVSEARAMRIISAMMKGVDHTEGMFHEKRQMYRDIFRRVKELRSANPEMPLGDIVFQVVNEPAPSSYLSLTRAAQIIYNARKGGKR